MTPRQFKTARKTLGLSAAAMARELRIPGQWAGRTIRRWEEKGSEVPGPVSVAVDYMLRVHRGELVVADPQQ